MESQHPSYKSSFERLVRMGTHDLKEALRMVSTYLGLLNREAKDSLNEEQQSYLKYAMEGSTRLTHLIEALGKYARAAAIPPQHSEVSTEKVISNVCRKWETVAVRPIQWQIGKLPALWGDVELIHDLFDRLISNAIKFTPPDHQIHISIQGKEDAGFSVIRISDEGIGIGEEFMASLFEPFHREHPRKEYPGVGLGLAYCREITELHRGRIRAESQNGKGSTFEVAFPQKV